jgi:hypothetical protein
MLHEVQNENKILHSVIIATFSLFSSLSSIHRKYTYGGRKIDLNILTDFEALKLPEYEKWSSE